MISEVQQPLFIKHYHTPLQRFHLLPPGIAQDRRAPANAAEIRAEFRAEFNLADDDLLLVQIGSGFKTKGLDRSLKALAALPRELKKRTRLIAIGQDDPRAFQLQAKTLGVSEQVQILKGRSDIPRVPARGRSVDSPGLQRKHRHRAAGGAGVRLAGAGHGRVRLRPLHRRGGCRAGTGSRRLSSRSSTTTGRYACRRAAPSPLGAQWSGLRRQRRPVFHAATRGRHHPGGRVHEVDTG